MNKFWQQKKDYAIKTEKEYDFPEFLAHIRHYFGFSRRMLSRDTGISHDKLVDLERGHFTLMPSDWVLGAIAEYYDLPVELFKSKCKAYCAKMKKQKTLPFYKKYPESTP